MLFRRSFYLILLGLVVGFWVGPVPAQVASIAIRELTLTPQGEQFRSFAGIPQTFIPGEENHFVVNPPVDFVNRVAKVTAVVDYSFDLARETESGAIFSCSFTIPEFPNEPGTNFVVRVDEGASSGSGTAVAGEGEMLLAEGIRRDYTFRCRIADPASLEPLAEAPIEVIQTYEPIDTIRILTVNPPTSEALTPGAEQTFVASVEYTRDVIRLGSQAILVATDGAGNELVPRNETGQNNSGRTATGDGPNAAQIELTLTGVPVPDDGFVQLHAEQVNGRQFGEFEEASYATYTTSAPVVYGEEPGVDFSIRHIEINQAVQDDENLIPLVADRPAVARVFVITPTPLEPGEVTVAQVTVTLRRDGNERVFTTPTIAALSEPGDALFPLRNTRLLSAEVEVPREFTRPGEMEVEAVVNLEGGEPIVPESNTGNNLLSQTFRFNERDTLAIGYVAVSNSGASDATAEIRKLFPVAPTRGLAYIPFALASTWDDFVTGLAEASMAASSGLVDVALVFVDPLINDDFTFGLSATIARLTNAPVVYTGVGPNAGRGAAIRIARLLLRSGVEPCGSAVDGDFNAVGWDVEASQLIRLDRYNDLVETCEDKTNVWISPSRYARLFLRDFRAQPAALRAAGKRQGAGELVLVSGEIRGNGSGSLSPLIRFPGAGAPAMQDSGEYCVEFSGASGSSRHCFSPDFSTLDVLPFAVVAPADAASNGVSLTRNGAEIASLTPSASAPVVAITAPGGGAAFDAGAALRVSWMASDADGDPLTAAVFYSADGGVTWAPLAAHVSGDSYDLDTTRIQGGEQVFVRVVVSDGLKTAHADAGPLTIRQSPAIDVAENFDLGDGAAGVTKTVFLPIASSGTGPLRIVSASFDNAAFEAASTLPLDLLPGTSGGLLVAVTPGSAGEHTASLTLETNAAGGSSVVRLTARGLAAEGPIFDVISSGEGILFPNTPVDGVAEAVVSVINRGGAALSYQATVEGSGFALAEGAALSADDRAQGAMALAPHQQDELLVQFRPLTTGEFAGELRITSDAPNLSVQTVALGGSGVVASELPVVNAGGVVDAASFRPGLSRGGIASLFGTNLASTTEAATVTPLPTSLAGVRVLIDGVAAPLFFVSPAQINFQMPFEALRAGAVQVAVSNAAGLGAPVAASTVPYAPAVFVNPASGEPIVTQPDGSLVTAASPARPGDVLILFVTGIGDLNVSPSTGASSGADPLSHALVLPEVRVGGSPAHVFFAGLAPGFVGLGQINIQLPAEVATDGGTATLVIDFDGQTSASVDVPVQGP
jgi:uncharacterized protein (TIGR03437 family)